MPPNQAIQRPIQFMQMRSQRMTRILFYNLIIPSCLYKPIYSPIVSSRSPRLQQHPPDELLFEGDDWSNLTSSLWRVCCACCVSINRFLISLYSILSEMLHKAIKGFSLYLARSKKASSTPIFALALVSMNRIPNSLAKFWPCSLLMTFCCCGWATVMKQPSWSTYPLILHITLVANQDLIDAFAGMLFNVGEPSSYI